MQNNIELIKSLVGSSITHDDLKFIECYTSETLAMFTPLGGSCGYALTPAHTHPSYMFVLAYDYETVIHVAKHSFQTSPNTMFCLAPEIKHHEQKNYFPPKYCAIFIEKRFFENMLDFYKKELFLEKGLTLKLQNTKIDMLTKEFMLEFSNKHSSSQMVQESIVTLLTHEIIRTVLDESLYNNEFATQSKIIIEVVKYINANYSQEICLDDISKSLEVSVSHISNIFKDEMGVSVMEYLKTLRLENAKKMLLCHTLSVTEVAQQCGFNSPSYFTKLFRQRYHVTPREYMNK